jgi:hypothetical protein
MRNDIVAQAQSIRNSMNVVTANLTDAEAVIVMDLYLPWKVGETYVNGDMRRDEGKLFRCLQGHTSQAEWKPLMVPALWVEVAAPGEYREIKENMLSTEAFAKDEIGWYKTEDNLWKSLIDANVYTPDSYPAGWEQVE